MKKLTLVINAGDADAHVTLSFGDGQPEEHWTIPRAMLALLDLRNWR